MSANLWEQLPLKSAAFLVTMASCIEFLTRARTRGLAFTLWRDFPDPVRGQSVVSPLIGLDKRGLYTEKDRCWQQRAVERARVRVIVEVKVAAG
jgi:hypothetical protein